MFSTAIPAKQISFNIRTLLPKTTSPPLPPYLQIQPTTTNASLPKQLPKPHPPPQTTIKYKKLPTKQPQFTTTTTIIIIILFFSYKPL